jgi:hypothetical protein
MLYAVLKASDLWFYKGYLLKASEVSTFHLINVKG